MDFRDEEALIKIVLCNFQVLPVEEMIRTSPSRKDG
jgi:hypothetical protein